MCGWRCRGWVGRRQDSSTPKTRQLDRFPVSQMWTEVSEVIGRGKPQDQGDDGEQEKRDRERKGRVPLTRRWAKIAQTKNSTSPIAAATPMNGMAMPAIKPTEPASFSAPSGSNHDCGTSTLATLATACSARRKSNEAAQTFIAAATTATATTTHVNDLLPPIIKLVGILSR